MVRLGKPDPVECSDDQSEYSCLQVCRNEGVAAAGDHTVDIFYTGDLCGDCAVDGWLYSVAEDRVGFFLLHEPNEAPAITEVSQHAGAVLLHGNLDKAHTERLDPVDIRPVGSGYDHFIAAGLDIHEEIAAEVVGGAVFR